MAHGILPLFVALAAAFGTASLVRAEMVIGVPVPMTGGMAWIGEQGERGAALAIAELNAAGGVLGEPVRALVVDDFCEGDQAVAAAKKLVAEEVALVAGHLCSGAALPASKVYQEAGILMISPTATNPALTEQGLANVFRMSGRDTLQGTMAAEYLAEHWRGRDVAIVHDGQAYGKGVAEAARERLHERGVSEVMFDAIEPGQVDYSGLIDKLQAEGIDALYFGGYTAEAGLIIRQARGRGYDLQMIGSDALITEYFWHLAGPAAVGVMFVSMADPRVNREAAAIVEQFRADGYEPEGTTLYSYAAVEVWAQAVEKAGTVEPEAVAAALRGHEFDTVLGRIGFDDKGDVYGYEPFVWYVWQQGNYAPVDPAKLTE
ncbi:MAG TPA: branched-chain amino acid ABC transporter substrate-binding protein [Geminicoccaceae bacterium]|nr:branched-chain amino acid ABC transporter substrate-binding protein [Geminicoccaceae bacterium]